MYHDNILLHYNNIRIYMHLTHVLNVFVLPLEPEREPFT